MRAARRALLLGVLAVAGCSSPEPAYYTLVPLPGVRLPPGAGTIKLRRIGLAGYLDRAQIVRFGDAYRLTLAAGERWADPLGDMIGRVLTEDLNQRLPGRLVFSATGSLTVDADISLAVDVQRFDADSSNMVTLLAQISVTRAGTGDSGRNVRITAQAPGAATQDLVATMSAVLGQFADQLAAIIAG